MSKEQDNKKLEEKQENLEMISDEEAEPTIGYRDVPTTRRVSAASSPPHVRWSHGTHREDP